MSEEFQCKQYLRDRGAREASFPEYKPPPYEFIIRPSYTTAMECLGDLLALLDKRETWVAADIETVGAQHISCIGFATSKTFAFCLPFLDRKKPNWHYWRQYEEFAVVEKIREVLLHPNLRLLGQNWLYDAQHIAKSWKVIAELFLDTSIWHHALFCGLPKRLDFLSSLYCEWHQYWKEDRKNWSGKAMVNEDRFWAYNCKDCVITYEVGEALDVQVRKAKFLDQARRLQSQHRPVLDMCLRGMRIDPARREEFHEELVEAINERQEYFKTLLGHPLNTRSNHATGGQMRKLFYGDFNLPPIISRKTKKPTLDEDALVKIGEKYPLMRPLVKGIEEERSLNVFKSTFVEAVLDPDGRMRSSINLTGTETFRYSSSKSAFDTGCNMQTIPSGEASEVAFHCKLAGPTSVRDLMALMEWDYAKTWEKVDSDVEAGYVTVAGTGELAVVYYRLLLPNVRKMFIPDPGYTIMDWDLSGADLQVVVWEADDEELKQMLRERVDVHSENAKLLHLSRPLAKRWVHLTDYGGSARAAAIACGMTVHESETRRRRWFSAHPGIRAWQLRTDAALQARSVWNKFGFRRFYFGRTKGKLPEALAWVPQSTVGLVTNAGLVNIHKNLPYVQLLMQVHDSLVMQVPTERFQESIQPIKENMAISIPYDDPLTIPVGCKYSTTSWGDAVELEI
jgi:DNA polymerase I-like protein with 3'-5' exonuclease and polymerase domains